MNTKEFKFKGFRISGFLAIFIGLVLLGVGLLLVAYQMDSYRLINILGFAILPILVKKGLLKVEPNEAVILVFFGKYDGTFTDDGFYWINPFYRKYKVPIRARNLTVEPIKVNDAKGNPVMIGAVFVWKINDTYKAAFDIDSKAHDIMQAANEFVRIQSYAALRQVAGLYAYDGEEESITLRSNGNEIGLRLEEELNKRLAMAGIHVLEARINYLAYAPEIARVMLRRQQAEAIVAAREKVVEGAVGMVELALQKLQKENIVELNEERRAVMVGNLLAILCADEAVHQS